MTTHSSLASVRATRQRLDELGLSTKKRLGQHFLVDDGIVGKIIRLAALTPGSEVIEVGPGIGTLTEALLAQDVRLTSVELDNALLNGLASKYPQLNIIGGDALAPSVIAQLKDLAPTALVANLPYAVAATIILEYFEQLPSLASATVMVQREVAERIAARSGCKEYGSYTVKLQLHACVKGQFKVSPQSFFPPPRVESTVIRLDRCEHVLASEASECSDRPFPLDSVAVPDSGPERAAKAASEQLVVLAGTLADAAFYQRRKTVRNSMQAYFAAKSDALDSLREGCFDSPANSLDQSALVDEALAACGIDPKTRGETLSVDTFLALAAAYAARINT